MPTATVWVGIRLQNGDLFCCWLPQHEWLDRVKMLMTHLVAEPKHIRAFPNVAELDLTDDWFWYQ